MKKGYIYVGVVAILISCLTSCQPADKPPLFTHLPASATQVDFVNTLQETDSFNINEYLYAYNGGGVAVGDLNNDGLPDLYFAANQAANHLYLNQGNFAFVDVTEKAGVAGWVGSAYWTTGVSLVDINADGWLDIYVNQVSGLPLFKGHNLLFINQQDGTFQEAAAQYGLDLQTFAQQTTFFDYDLDGDLDAYLLNHSLHEKNVYVKAENRHQRDSLAGDRLLRNDNGYFTDVSAESSIFGSPTGYGLSVSIADLDNNAYPDIYVTNDFHENDYLYLNQGDGTFRETIRSALPYCSTFSMGSDIADLNNDGYLDLMTLDMKPEDEVIRKQSSGADAYEIFKYKLSFGYHEQYARNMLHLNLGPDASGTLHYSEMGQLAGVAATDWSWSVLLADLDNDRHKDIFITNGILRRPNDLDYINYTFHQGKQNHTPALQLVELMSAGQARNYAFRNPGTFPYEDVSAAWGLDFAGYSTGAAYADLDQDGDLDLLVNNLNAPAGIYRNNTTRQSNHHYLKVALQGAGANTQGIGARVTVYTKGEQLVQEMQPVRGWLSASAGDLVFGLGGAAHIDSVLVQWPSGKKQSLLNPAIDQTLLLNEQDATDQSREKKEVQPLFEKVVLEAPLFEHHENDFADFNHEILLPHQLSNLGPCMAKADINGDGLEDLFIGGAAGQAAGLLVQQATGVPMLLRTPPVFLADLAKEDVAAAFFDADQDGDPDLYVVSGGGQFISAEANRDRLYLNDGLGNFTRASHFAAPGSNGACVVAADFDGDGQTDLFVGSRSVVGRYGQVPPSYLLWNKGDAHFVATTLLDLGMVTDAAWDAKDQILLVVGEWMPLTRLSFSGAEIVRQIIPHSGGWWNKVLAADLDGDGDTDFLLGNSGWNTPLHPDPEHPLRLVVNDWDQNGQPDPLITYYRQGKEWIYHSLDLIRQQIPPVRVKYPTYDKYAVHTVKQFFAEAPLDTIPVYQAHTLASSFLWNRGAGTLVREDLPIEAQCTALYAFYAGDWARNGQTAIIALGNTSGNTPAIGNQMASLGQLLQSVDGEYQVVPARESGLYVTGEVRAAEALTIRGQTWLFIGKNNAPLELIRLRNSPSFSNL